MKHRIRWIACAGDERIPATKSMSRRHFGWDAVCSCGWESATGGAIRASVERDVFFHKFLSARAEAEQAPVNPVS